MGRGDDKTSQTKAPAVHLLQRVEHDASVGAQGAQPCLTLHAPVRHNRHQVEPNVIVRLPAPHTAILLYSTL